MNGRSRNRIVGIRTKDKGRRGEEKAWKSKRKSLTQ